MDPRKPSKPSQRANSGAIVSHTGQRRVSAELLEDTALGLGRDLRIKEFSVSSVVGVPVTARP